MVKKILIAVVFALLIVSSSIAAAEEYDWSQAPQIDTKTELARYIEDGRRNGQTTFRFIFTGAKVDNQEALDNLLNEITNVWAVVPLGSLVQEDGYGTERFTYKITKEYAGTHVANAYLSGDTAFLTPDEFKLYNEAVRIVNAAKKLSTPIEQERYLHDEICKRATFKSYTNEDAIGALILGVTNCQGYADAFYMLGRMCGFNVVRVQGIGDGKAHVWNTITFDDGKTYCVDVTFDDRNFFGKLNSYAYFNAPLEVMEGTHSYQWDLIPSLQQFVDNRYSYRAFKELAQASSAEDGLKLIVRKLARGKSWFSVMTPFDEKFSEDNVQQTADYVAKKSGKDINLNTWQRGNYLFFTAMLRAN